MASIQDFVAAKLKRFKDTVLGPSTPPPQVDFSRFKQTPRLQAAIKQTQPLIQQAYQAHVDRYPVTQVPGSIPRFNLAPALTNKIKNPAVRTISRFAAEIPNDLINIPTDVFGGAQQFVGGMGQLGTALGNRYVGNQVPIAPSLQQTLSGLGRTGTGAVNLLTLGSAPAATAGVKQLAKLSVKQAANKAGLATAKLGALQGGLHGAMAQENDSLGKQAGRIAGGAVLGGLAGYGIGAGAGALSARVGQIRQDAFPKVADRTVTVRSQGGKYGGSVKFNALRSPASDIKSIASPVMRDKLARERIQGLVQGGADKAAITRFAADIYRDLKGGPQTRDRLIRYGHSLITKQRLASQGGYIRPFENIGPDESASEIGEEISVKLSSGGNMYIKSGKEIINNLPKTVQDDIYSTRNGDILSVDRMIRTNNFLNRKGLELTREGKVQKIPVEQNLRPPLIVKNGEAYYPSQMTKTGVRKVTPDRFKELTGLDLPPQLVKAGSQRGTPSNVRGSARGDIEGAVQDIRNRTLGQSLTPPPQGPGRPYTDIISNSPEITPGQKVGFFDFLRTPDRVLEKIGLKRESDFIREQYGKYIAELPGEIDKVTQWATRAPGQESNVKIFKYLDGDEKVVLTPTEQQVANEIKTYLSKWADRLGLPRGRRIASYITHIFEKDFIQKEFDPDVAMLIRDKVPGSVYDPFLQQRLGKMGYVEDTWRALDAYVKRATRKANLDPALQQMKAASERLEESQFDYVKKYIDRVNLRPSKIDNLLDNTIKQMTGYRFGQRPTAYLSKKIRQITYRGSLGLNVGSAIRNLTQGVNTYSKLGEKYTLIGYAKLLGKMATNDLDELRRVGVLQDGFVQDRKLSAIKGVMERLDKGLFFFFETAEKINRGSAYFGAKAQALAKGMSEKDAVKHALKIVRDTQFTFGSIDTPPILQSDLTKIFTQFQSFNVKQAEFLTELIKSKELPGIARWLGANTLMIALVGEALGLEYKDMIPFSGVATGETKLGQTPAIRMAKGLIQGAIAAPDRYGNVPEGNALQRIYENSDVRGSFPAFIPGGVQGVKTFKGLQSSNRGYTTTASGRAKYPVEQSLGSTIQAGVMGEYSGPIARFYYANKMTPLGDSDTKELNKKIEGGQDPKQAFYDIYVQRMARSEKSPDEKATILQDLREVLELDGSTLVPAADASGEQPVTALTTGAKGYAAAKAEKEKYEKLSELLNSDLPEEEKAHGITSLGFSEPDAGYYEVARQDTDLKVEFVKDILNGVPTEQRLEVLAPLRREMNGHMILTGSPKSSTGVADKLYQDDVITKDERDYLKAIEYDVSAKSVKKLKVAAKKGKKAKKPRKVSLRKVGSIKVPKLKVAQPRSSSSGYRKLKITIPKPITVSQLTASKRPNNDLESFKRALLARRGA